VIKLYTGEKAGLLAWQEQAGLVNLVGRCAARKEIVCNILHFSKGLLVAAGAQDRNSSEAAGNLSSNREPVLQIPE
jgi:hypothetical protein